MNNRQQLGTSHKNMKLNKKITIFKSPFSPVLKMYRCLHGWMPKQGSVFCFCICITYGLFLATGRLQIYIKVFFSACWFFRQVSTPWLQLYRITNLIVTFPRDNCVGDKCKTYGIFHRFSSTHHARYTLTADQKHQLLTVVWLLNKQLLNYCWRKDRLLFYSYTKWSKGVTVFTSYIHFRGYGVEHYYTQKLCFSGETTVRVLEYLFFLPTPRSAYFEKRRRSLLQNFCRNNDTVEWRK